MIKIDRIPTRATPHGLGRHIDHDERSRNFTYTPTRQLATVLHSMPVAAVLDQGELGGCTGFAMATLLNTDHFSASRRAVHGAELLTNADGISLYSMATDLDNLSGTYPPNDFGSSGLGAVKAAKTLGYVTSYSHTFSFQSFCAAVSSQPVIVGTDWTDSMFTPNSKGVATVGELTEETIAGGHEYLCRGINVEQKLLRFRNSWGTGWGVGGDFFLGFTDFAKLLAHHGDVVAPRKLA